MGLSLPVVQVFLGLWKDGHFSGMDRVLDVGSQQLLMSLDDFEEAVTAYGVPGFVREDFEPWEWESRGKCCYADRFYALLGLDKYKCFDLNGENGAIAHDLNMPFEDKKHWNSFDLVTDFGCAEHMFNVAEVYRTMHRVCRPGGVLLHGQQMFHTNGYYLYDPSFYEDLAAANGYEILFSGLLVSGKPSLSVPEEACMKDWDKNRWLVPMSHELLDVLDWTKIAAVGMIYAMKKVNDEDFRIPYQEKLMSSVYGNDGYELAALSNYRRPTRVYVPVVDPFNNISSSKFKRVCKAYFKKKLPFLK